MKKKKALKRLEWKGWKTQILHVKDQKPCKHYFHFINGECRCKYCGFGLTGVVDIVDGRPV
jgi:hypothetical protein